ncbi:CapA family protein [Candidatus Kaiserbacteria bacterium]|nr:CapA family protein [Candidatus Kaiserbacteria bacterium]
MDVIIQKIASLVMSLTMLLGTASASAMLNYRAGEASSIPQARIVFGGDMLFDRTIRVAADAKGGDFIFSCIEPLFTDADLVVANLEGPITANPSVSVDSHVADGNNYTFTFPVSTAKLLYAHNVRVVNIGNNHISNFLAEGVRSTMQYLDDAGVQYFGDPFAQKTATTSINGVRLAFVNFNQFERASTEEITVGQIHEARANGFLPVVYTHWGEEYVPATDYEKTLAHEFINAGAEMVVGSHPHVIQEHEIYAGKHIYYSLGNLFFDQYWNADVRTGLLLDVTFTKNGVRGVEERRVELERDRRTCPIATMPPKSE